MKIYDLSLTIRNGIPVWPGDPKVKLERISKIEEGANSNVSHIGMSVHTATHVDAPIHFIQGAKTIEMLPLDVLVGRALVVELPLTVDEIGREEIEQAGIPAGTERLIIKTRNSSYWRENDQVFQRGFVGVNLEGAIALVGMGIRLVGIDYLSISPFKKSRPTHEVLLGAEIVIVEGLNLDGVSPGWYTLVCLPLKLGGSDGAPARVILLEERE